MGADGLAVTTFLTRRRLLAIQAALTAMAAGPQGEGDWPPEIRRSDMDAAEQWAHEQLEQRRNSKRIPKAKAA